MSNPAHDDLFGDLFPDGSKPPQPTSHAAMLAKLLGVPVEEIEEMQAEMLKDYAAAERDANLIMDFASTLTLPAAVLEIGVCRNPSARYPSEWADICLVNIEPVIKPPRYKEGLTWKEAGEACALFAVAVGIICRGKRILRGDPPMVPPTTL